MTERPGLRNVYDRLAEQVGPQLSDLTASDRFAEVVEVTDAVRIRAGSELQRSSRRFLHALNLPAGSDVTVLRQEIGSLERTVRSLARQVETLQQRLDEVADDGSSSAENSASTEAGSNKSGSKTSGSKKSGGKKKTTGKKKTGKKSGA